MLREPGCGARRWTSESRSDDGGYALVGQPTSGLGAKTGEARATGSGPFGIRTAMNARLVTALLETALGHLGDADVERGSTSRRCCSLDVGPGRTRARGRAAWRRAAPAVADFAELRAEPEPDWLPNTSSASPRPPEDPDALGDPGGLKPARNTPPVPSPQRGRDAGVARTRPWRPRRRARGAADVRARRPVHRHGGHEPARRERPGGDVVVAEAAGRQHAPGRRLPARAWSSRARTAAPTRRATAGTTWARRACPPELYDRQVASGFTHFQQSGTGAIRKYYNYFRVTPMVQPLDELGTAVGPRRRDAPSPASTRRRCPRASAPRSRSAPRAPSTATRSRRTATRGSSSTSRSAGCRSRTARRCRCGRTCTSIAAGIAPGRDRRRGRAAGGPHGVRRTRAGGSCSGTTVG